MNKKELPLKMVIGIKNLKDHIKTIVKQSKHLKIEIEDVLEIRVIDTDENSEFSFEIYNCRLFQDTPYFSFLFKPQSDAEIEGLSMELPLLEALNKFNEWCNIIDSYNKVNLTPDEDILKSNEERFLEEFQLLDDDANQSSFNLSQLLYLDDYLAKVHETLNQFKEEKSEADIVMIDELQKDVADTKATLTRNTKNEVLSKLVKIWSKAQMIGLDIAKDVFVKYITELTVKLIGG